MRPSGFLGSGRGQALIETALALPIVLFVLLAVVDFAMAYQRQVQISAAVRSGARYGSYYPANVDSSSSADPNNIKYQVKNGVASATLTDSNISVDYEVYGTNPPPSYAATSGNSQYAVSGNFVRVSVSYTYVPISFYLNVIAPSGAFTLSSSAVVQIQ